jgi:hypothetical protein
MTPALDIKTIRPKAYAVLRKAGEEIAKSYPSRIRGWKNWSRGVTLAEMYGGPTCSAGIYVRSYYDIRSAAQADVDRAITALRTAGWTVTDDGRIEAMPEPSRKPTTPTPSDLRE